MLVRTVRSVRRVEDGYAIVVAVLLLAIMMVSLVVALDAGNSALRESELGVRWTRTLAIAEAGIDDAKAALAVDRSAVSACPTGGTDVCQTIDGEYQVSWTSSAGAVTVTSTGYYPAMDDAQFSRRVEVLLEPEPEFVYALFAQDSLETMTGQVVNGSIYSTGNVLVRQNSTVCGSIVAAGGSITLENGVQIVKSNAATGCSGQAGDIWAGGSVAHGVTAQTAGNVKASAPSGVTCGAAATGYRVTGGGNVAGRVTACGSIAATVVSAGGTAPFSSTSPPATETLPGFTFNPANYASITCYPVTCVETITSGTAVADFNAYFATKYTGFSGAYAIWQTSPTKDTKINLGPQALPGGTITLTGDTTIITNAPIDLGNTSNIVSAAGPVELVIVSLWVPPTGTSCSTEQGDYCSIYAKNVVTIDQGGTTDLSDGIATLIYTPGKMAWKNTSATANSLDGAMYAGTMDIKNGFKVTYNGRIARVLGFGSGLEQTLWRELAD